MVKIKNQHWEFETDKKNWRRKKKHPWWRPEVINDSVIAKLELAFSYGFNDWEACLYSEISEATLYRYIEKNPKFWEKKEILKNKPKIKAKMNVLEKLNEKDIDTSKWYLERRSKDEFSLKTESENKITAEISISKEWEGLLQELE